MPTFRNNTRTGFCTPIVILSQCWRICHPWDHPWIIYWSFYHACNVVTTPSHHHLRYNRKTPNTLFVFLSHVPRAWLFIGFLEAKQFLSLNKQGGTMVNFEPLRQQRQRTEVFGIIYKQTSQHHAELKSWVGVCIYCTYERCCNHSFSYEWPWNFFCCRCTRTPFTSLLYW